jgi:peptidoglycan/xylan/chitin deacetylase (PgdA/CDA1 family)
MSTYTRRRLLAGAAAALIVAAVVVGLVAVLGGGGGHKSAAESRPLGTDTTAGGQSATVAPELAAHPARTVAQPTEIQGDGPFWELHGTTVQRIAPPYRRGRVALTFDDGPGPFTKQILAELESLHARATFFLIGQNVKDSPDTVKELRAAGMVVGNHTWTHPNMTKLGFAGQRAQIERTQKIIQATIGQRPRFFRPPTWAWNRTTARVVADEGMLGVLFSIDTQDWTLPGVTAIVRSALQARDGQVIALHDAGGDREQTVQALPLIIKGLRAQGLELVTLDELFRKSPA